MNETNATSKWSGMESMDAVIDVSIIEDVVGDTWNTYLAAAIELCAPRGEPGSDSGVGQDPVEASVYISGEVVWQVTLRGSWNSAEEATRRMLGVSDLVSGTRGEKVMTADEYVLDAWGELVNTVAGNLKASLALQAQQLSVPEVFRDRSTPPPTSDMTELPFDWDGYHAVVRIAAVRSA